VVVHSCNPSYLGGGDWEDCGLRLSRVKKVSEIPFQPGMVVHTCSYVRCIGLHSEAGPGQKHKTIPEK
jgi:hypothetical protein